MMYYLGALLLFWVVELLYFYIAYRYNIIDIPNKRSSHKHIALRGGGIIFYLAVLFYFTTNGRIAEYPWFLLGLTLVAFISFWDDVRSVSGGIRLFFHFVAVAMMICQWNLFSMAWWAIVAIGVTCVGIINSYNFMDGINGITSGYSFVVLSALAYVNWAIIPFADQKWILIMLCSVVVFSCYNFRTQAKCFVGDVGSISMAFTILFLIGLLVIKTDDLSWIVLLSVYGVDTVLTIIHRLMLHENIYLSHRKHLYQMMANELGIPHVMVSLVYMVVQGLIFIGYLQFRGFGYWYLATCVAVLSAIYVIFMKKSLRMCSCRR